MLSHCFLCETTPRTGTLTSIQMSALGTWRCRIQHWTDYIVKRYEIITHLAMISSWLPNYHRMALRIYKDTPADAKKYSPEHRTSKSQYTKKVSVCSAMNRIISLKRLLVRTGLWSNCLIVVFIIISKDEKWLVKILHFTLRILIEYILCWFVYTFQNTSALDMHNIFHV